MLPTRRNLLTDTFGTLLVWCFTDARVSSKWNLRVLSISEIVTARDAYYTRTIIYFPPAMSASYTSNVFSHNVHAFMHLILFLNGSSSSKLAYINVSRLSVLRQMCPLGAYCAYTTYTCRKRSTSLDYSRSRTRIRRDADDDESIGVDGRWWPFFLYVSFYWPITI